jgi:hypothetical protein
MPNIEKALEEKMLPKPVSLTPEEIQRVAAGTAAVLPACVKPPTIAGGIRVQE